MPSLGPPSPLFSSLLLTGAGPGAGALPAPENFAATAGDDTVNLVWNAVTGAVAYNVYRDGLLLDTVTELLYLDNVVANGTEYEYTVTAYNGSIESAKSLPQTVLPFWVIENFAASNQTSEGFDITWEPLSAPLPNPGVEIHIQEDGGDWSSPVQMNFYDPSIPAVITQLLPDTAYELRLRAKNGADVGVWSDVLELSTSEE